MSKTRLTITLDEEESELFRRLKELTGQSPAQVIQALIPSHMKDMWEYVTWLEQLPKDNSKQSRLGPFILQSFGPETLMESVKQLDPTYNPKGK